jgi:hypothetical protein
MVFMASLPFAIEVQKRQDAAVEPSTMILDPNARQNVLKGFDVDPPPRYFRRLLYSVKSAVKRRRRPRPR